MCREIRSHLVQIVHGQVRNQLPFNFNHVVAEPRASIMTREEINQTFWLAASDTGDRTATISQLNFYLKFGGDVDYRPNPDRPTVAEQLLATVPATDNGERAAFIARCREKNEKK